MNNTEKPRATESLESTTSESSKNPVEQAKEQVQQVLKENNQGFSFESIKESVLNSFANLWKSLGIGNLIKHITDFFGMSFFNDKETSEQTEQTQEETSAPKRHFELSECDQVPSGGKTLYAQSNINIYKSTTSSSKPYAVLFKGQTVITMPNQPDSSGFYKVKALGRGTQSQSIQYLYIKQDDFKKLKSTNPGPRKSIGMNMYLSGDSISQVFSGETAYGEGMPSHKMQYIVKSIAGQVAAGRITQKRLGFIMGFNNLSSKSFATIRQIYLETFSILKSLQQDYGKDIAINGLFNWTQDGKNYMNPTLLQKLNDFIKESCNTFGFKFVSMEQHHDPSKGLHEGFLNKEDFINKLSS